MVRGGQCPRSLLAARALLPRTPEGRNPRSKGDSNAARKAAYPRGHELTSRRLAPKAARRQSPKRTGQRGVCKGVRRLDSATRRATTRRRVCPVVGAASPSWVSLTARRRRVSLRGRAVVLAALTASGGTGR